MTEQPTVIALREIAEGLITDEVSPRGARVEIDAVLILPGW